VACAIALVSCWWIVRYASVRPGALCRSVGLPLVGALGMIPVVLLLGRLPWPGSGPSWASLLTLGPLALAAYTAIMLVIMPDPLRKGWAALRGGSDDDDLQADPEQAGPEPAGPEPAEAQGDSGRRNPAQNER
jgi:hypothetical protein